MNSEQLIYSSRVEHTRTRINSYARIKLPSSYVDDLPYAEKSARVTEEEVTTGALAVPIIRLVFALEHSHAQHGVQNLQ